MAGDCGHAHAARIKATDANLSGILSRIREEWRLDSRRFVSGFDNPIEQAAAQLLSNACNLRPASEVDVLEWIGRQIIHHVLDVLVAGSDRLPPTPFRSRDRVCPFRRSQSAPSHKFAHLKVNFVAPTRYAPIEQRH